MTAILTSDGKWVHFPTVPFNINDSTNVIEPPPDDQLDAIAEAVAPSHLLRCVYGLTRSANKRRFNERWRHINRSKTLLAKLLLERALREGLVA